MNVNDQIDTPHNIEAEQSVLGALLLDNDAVDRMGDVRVEHFYRQDHRAIFTEIRTQIGAGTGCDVISVFDAIREKVVDCLQYLNSLAQNTPSSANISRYAEMVRDSALRRGLIAATWEMADMAANPKGKSATQVLDFAQGTVAALAETRTTKEPIRASDALVSHVDIIEGRMDRKFSGISTGLDDLDAILLGGPNRGALVILGARPSMGKSALAENIAIHAAQDHGVLFLSQEMSTGELIDRALASIGRISLSAIISGEMDNEDWTKFSAASAKVKDLNLHFDDQPALTLLDVRAKARLIKRKHGLDLVVVDYLQLMSGDGDNRNQQIEEISRGLKALAKELNVVVLALSQLSRAAANKSRPQLSDLRDSGAIEQDADIVIFLHRDEVDNPSTHMRGMADLFVAKNRQGRIDDVLIEYEGMYTRFCTTRRERPAAPAQSYKRGLAAAL